jgi:hypothetical protein
MSFLTSVFGRKKSSEELLSPPVYSEKMVDIAEKPPVYTDPIPVSEIKIDPMRKDILITRAKSSSATPESMYELGQYYLESESNPNLMKAWMIRAIKEKYGPACHYLGKFYSKTEIDVDKMLNYYTTGAEIDHIDCIYELGMHYLSQHDYYHEKAFGLFTKSICLGDSRMLNETIDYYSKQAMKVTSLEYFNQLGAINSILAIYKIRKNSICLTQMVNIIKYYLSEKVNIYYRYKTEIHNAIDKILAEVADYILEGSDMKLIKTLCDLCETDTKNDDIVIRCYEKLG